jgi:putative ABC transport system permease protein
MTSLAQASRLLARRPLFLSAAVLTIGAGVAITTALFSVVDRVLLQPLPFPDGGQLVSMYEASASGQQRASLIAPARLEDWTRLNRTFEAISASYSENVTDTSGGEPERLEGRRVSPRFFKVFGMTPLLGRTFTDDEERFGGPTTAVISESFWSRRFGRDPAAVGKTLTIGGRGYAIVGVMPRAFTSATTDVWIPAQIGPWLMSARDARFLGGVGRMSRGVTLEEARADLARVQQTLGEQYLKTDKDWGVEIRDLKEVRVGDYRRALVLLFGAVALLFVIAIANVAGLMLVQLHRRAGEFAIRRAIGASDRRIVSVVLLEALVIAVAGGAVGAAASVWLTRLIATTFSTVPRMAEVALNGRALGFAAAASLLAVGAFGLLPALFATRHEILPLLTPAGRNVSGGRHRLQGALVVSQIALSMLLAGSAALLVRSYGAMTRAPLGFETGNVFTFHVGAAWDEDRKRVGQLQEQILIGLQQLPGVRAAGFTNFLPAGGATLRYQVRVDGLAGPDQSGNLTVGMRGVSAGYLQALRTQLVAGESCPELRIGMSYGRAVLVNRRFVDMYSGSASLIGREMRVAQLKESARIVGVIGNMLEDGAAAPVMPYIYMCMGAGWWPDPSYVVRAEGDPRTAIAAVRQLVRTLDPARPMFGVKPLEDVIGDSLEQPRSNARLLALFAAAALALAALGMYGLLMLLVAERRRELGVRMALGAAPIDLIRLVLSGAGRLVISGMAVGLVLTFAAGHAFRTMLFGVAPHDPRALAAGVLALALVSAAAILIPARKAASISATEAMRGE